MNTKVILEINLGADAPSPEQMDKIVSRFVLRAMGSVSNRPEQDLMVTINVVNEREVVAQYWKTDKAQVVMDRQEYINTRGVPFTLVAIVDDGDNISYHS